MILPVPAPEPAIAASAFVDSIGVCTHWSYGDTPYGFAYERVRDLLVDSGVRHYRDGFSGRVPDLAKRGLRLCVALDPEQEPTTVRDRIKALNAERPAVDAVEGANEPDLFWVNAKRSYRGQPFPKGAVDFQRDLHAILKADPATKGLTLIGPSLGKSYDPADANPFRKGELEPFVDLGNFHPYPFGGNPFSLPTPYGGLGRYYWHGSFPSVNLDEWPRAFDVARPPFGARPMAATETGYSTWAEGALEASQARYVPRLFCEYRRLGVRRTYLYEFIDEFEDPKGGNSEAHFGIVRRDLTPKPAYLALRSLLRAVADPGVAATRAEPLDLRLEVGKAGAFDRTQYVHRLLLQKRDGEHLLLLWHEVSAEDASKRPRTPVAVPPMPVALTLPRGHAVRGVLRYDPDWSLKPESLKDGPGPVRLEVPDSVIVVRIAKA